jgi:hypothetical protein
MQVQGVRNNVKLFLFQFWEGRNFQTKSTEGKKVISMNVGLTPAKEFQQLIGI